MCNRILCKQQMLQHHFGDMIIDYRYGHLVLYYYSKYFFVKFSQKFRKNKKKSQASEFCNTILLFRLFLCVFLLYNQLLLVARVISKCGNVLKYINFTYWIFWHFLTLLGPILFYLQTTSFISF